MRKEIDVCEKLSFVQSQSERFCSQLKDNQMGLSRQTERSEDVCICALFTPMSNQRSSLHIIIPL